MTPQLSNRLAPVARALRLVIPSLILSGCAVGLNTSIPTAPSLADTNWNSQFAQTTEQRENWWTLLQDPQLDALIAKALDHNLDIAQAQARWRA